MKILIADIFLRGRPNQGWKEGYVLKYALENLGHECLVAGPDAEISELEIPNIANQFDLVIISENYPSYSGWKWWNWKEIKIPKLFWAIDTHIVNFKPFNNKSDMDTMSIKSKKIWFPYAVSKYHYDIDFNESKKYDVTFIGGITNERQRLIDKFNIKHISAFGDDYVKEMKRSKICFNKSISHDLNAKYFEILGSGSFMLTNYNDSFFDFVEENSYIEKMFYIDENDLSKKIDYYLNNNEEREEIAKKANEYIIQNHTFESRIKIILDNVL
jgi:spore maturation protein CgeB